MNDDTTLTWNEAVEFVRQRTGGQIILVRAEGVAYLEWIGTEMALCLQDDLATDRGYLIDSLEGWERWPEEWSNYPDPQPGP